MGLRQKVFPEGLKVYHGGRRFLMLTPSYLLDRSSHPYHRLSATIILCCRGSSLQLDAGEHTALKTQAVLIAPNVTRRRTLVQDGDVALFDIPVVSAEYAVLAPLLEKEQILPIDFEQYKHLLPRLYRAARKTLGADQIDDLFSDVLEAVSGQRPGERVMDARVEKALALIDEWDFDKVSLAALASEVHLSSSRLRHLFTRETGYSIAQYARWVAVWKATELWSQGRLLTDVAHEVGFYDQAHLHRAFNEVFGWNPSVVIDPAKVTLIRCD